MNRTQLIKLRQRLGLSQEQVADECQQQRLYVSVSSLKRAELEHPVLLRTAHNLARFYGVDVEDLVMGESVDEKTFPMDESSPYSSEMSEELQVPVAVSKKVIGLYIAATLDVSRVIRDLENSISIHYSSPSFHVLLLKNRHANQKPTAHALSIIREIARYNPEAIVVIKPVLVEFNQTYGETQPQVCLPMTERFGIERLAKQQPLGTVLVHHELFHCCHLEFNFTFNSNPVFAPGPWYSVTEYTLPDLNTVGREHEQQFLRSLLEQLTNEERGCWCNITGTAGIGKTHMTLSLTGQALKRDVGHILLQPSYRAIGSNCTNSENNIHPGARLILDLVKMREINENQLKTLMIDLGLDGYWHPFIYYMFRIQHKGQPICGWAANMSPYLFRTSCQKALEIMLTALLKSRKQLIVIEEIHQFDEEMHQTLKALANIIELVPLLLITTSYSDLIAGFDRHDIRTVRLYPLTLLQSKELAEAHGGQASKEWRERSIRRAQGNPLFLIELLHNEHLRDELPFNITYVVAARTETISPKLKGVLELLSISGDGLTKNQLEELLQSPLEQFATLVNQGLLQPMGERWFFTHPLLREAIYQSMPEDICRRRHAMLARWLGDKDPVQHAIHLAKSGSEQALPVLLVAAEHLVNDRHYEQAHQLLHLMEPLLQSNRDKYKAYRMRAITLNALGNIPLGIATALAAINHCEDERNAAQDWSLLARMYQQAGQLEDALHARNCVEILVERYRQLNKQETTISPSPHELVPKISHQSYFNFRGIHGHVHSQDRLRINAIEETPLQSPTPGYPVEVIKIGQEYRG